MGAWKQKATSGGNGGDFPKAPPGNHPARLVAMIDLGDQENSFQGKTTIQHRVYFAWELVSEPIPGIKGRNFVVGIDLTLSLNEKAKLRGWIESWRGKKLAEGEEFDIDVLLGKPCLLNVAANEQGYPKITGIGPAPKGFSVPEPLHKPFKFDLDEIKPDGSFELPDWLPYSYGSSIPDLIRSRKNGQCEKVGATAPAGDAKEPEEIPW